MSKKFIRQAFCEPVHPSVSKLASLRAERDQLQAQLDRCPSIELCYNDGVSPFARADCKIVDHGVADHCYVIKCDVIAKLQAQVQQQELVIERLPKTKDGVTVAPWDDVWHTGEGMRWEVLLNGLCCKCKVVVKAWEDPQEMEWQAVVEHKCHYLDRVAVEDCYSTREAAEAARQESENILTVDNARPGLRIRHATDMPMVVRTLQRNPGDTYWCYWPHPDEEFITISDRKLCDWRTVPEDAEQQAQEKES